MCRATITISIGENGQPFEIIAVDEYNGNEAELFRIRLPQFQVGKFFCPLCGDEIVNAYPTAREIRLDPDDGSVTPVEFHGQVVTEVTEPTTLVGVGPNPGPATLLCPCCDSDIHDDEYEGCICVEGCPNS